MYTLIIRKEGNDIFSKDVSADEVIEFLTQSQQTLTIENVGVVFDTTMRAAGMDKKGGKKRALGKCSKCGTTGHNYKTCVRKDQSTIDDYNPVHVVKEKKEETEFAFPRKTLMSTTLSDRKVMSMKEFAQVRYEKTKLEMPEAIAENMKLSLEEVERAYDASNYREYQG